MKKLLLLAIALLGLNTYAGEFENVVGDFEVTYSNKVLFFGQEGSFKISFKEIEGKYGEVTFESNEFGFCTSEVSSDQEYGYAVYSNTIGSNFTPFKINYPSRIKADVFCPEWRELVIEVRPGSLENLKVGEKTDVGFYLRDNHFNVVLESKGKIERL